MMTEGMLNELQFQRGWALLFCTNINSMAQYWKEYLFLDEIKEVCGLSGGKRILDVGCGISSVLHSLEGEKYGLDILADRYSKIYKYPDDINLTGGSGDRLPFRDGTFDAVFCTNALDHIEGAEACVEEIQRVLKEGGYFVLSVEIFRKEGGKRNANHPHSFTERGLKTLLDGAFRMVYLKKSMWLSPDHFCRGKRWSSAENMLIVSKKVGHA